MSWVLVFYLSTNMALSSATGGPATIQGFQTKEACMSTGERFKKEVPKFDWYVCVQADVPVTSAK